MDTVIGLLLVKLYAVFLYVYVLDNEHLLNIHNSRSQ